MKKYLLALLIVLMPIYAYSANEWRAGTTTETIPGSTSVSDIE